MKILQRLCLASAGLASLTLAGSAAAVMPSRPHACQPEWLQSQADARLPKPYTVFDYSGPSPEEQQKEEERGESAAAEKVAPGRVKAIVEQLKKALAPAASRPVSVLIAGPEETLEPILDKLLPALKGKKLPHLTLLLIAPEELERETRAAFQRLGAKVEFAPFEHHRCGGAAERK